MRLELKSHWIASRFLHWMASLCLALSAFIAHAQSGTSPPFELKASLAFARATPDQYLLVYSSNEVGSGAAIYGRVLNLDGSPSGRDFRLSTQVGLMTKPVLVYNPVTEQFLVVWGRKQFGKDRAEIIGLSVGLNGRIIGEELQADVSIQSSCPPPIFDFPRQTLRTARRDCRSEERRVGKECA